MRSSGRIRKAIVRFGDDFEIQGSKQDGDITSNNITSNSPHTNSMIPNDAHHSNNDNGLRKSQRTQKRPRTLDDDYKEHHHHHHQQVLKPQPASVPKATKNHKSKKNVKEHPSLSTPKKKICTTKSGLKYVVKVSLFGL